MPLRNSYKAIWLGTEKSFCIERSVMDSQMQTQPEYVGHTAKDASTSSRQKQEVPIDAALAA